MQRILVALAIGAIVVITIVAAQQWRPAAPVAAGGFTPTPTPTPTPPPTFTPTPAFLQGDVNCDGLVNSLDALWILQLEAGFVASLPCLQNADVNLDGRINAVDAAIILQFVAGLIDSLPASSPGVLGLPAQPTVAIASTALPVGAQGAVQLQLLDMGLPGLGAWTIDIRFDPTVVTAKTCTPHNGGVCNPFFAGDTMRVTGASAVGLLGDIDLATLRFTCDRPAISPLTISIRVLADATIGAPQPITANIRNGVIACAVKPTVTIGSLSRQVGTQGSVDLRALNVPPPGLGAWTIDVMYDPAVVAVKSCTPTSLALSVCSTAFNSVTIRTTGASPTGLEGDTTLATITFTCRNEGISGLGLSLDIFHDATVGDPQDMRPFTNVDDGAIACDRGPTHTPPPPPTPTPLIAGGAGRMTGGGSVFADDGTRVTHGFRLECDTDDAPNNLEVNWRGNRFHLEQLTFASCFDDRGIEPNPPDAGFDTYQGAGTGRLNGVRFASATWLFTDAGEPGTGDRFTILIDDAEGYPVLSVSGLLTRGNHQAHDGPADAEPIVRAGADGDADACPDGAELGNDPVSGGGRDRLNHWDYFNPTRDGQNRIDDILAVVGHYHVDEGMAGYDMAHDRTYLGPNAWNLGPPDGVQRIDDILAAVKQYRHDCG